MFATCGADGTIRIHNANQQVFSVQYKRDLIQYKRDLVQYKRDPVQYKRDIVHLVELTGPFAFKC